MSLNSEHDFIHSLSISDSASVLIHKLVIKSFIYINTSLEILEILSERPSK